MHYRWYFRTGALEAYHFVDRWRCCSSVGHVSMVLRFRVRDEMTLLYVLYVLVLIVRTRRMFAGIRILRVMRVIRALYIAAGGEIGIHRYVV